MYCIAFVDTVIINARSQNLSHCEYVTLNVIHARQEDIASATNRAVDCWVDVSSLAHGASHGPARAHSSRYIIDTFFRCWPQFAVLGMAGALKSV